MKHKVKIPPKDLKIGMRIKFPIGGWWFGSEKKSIWCKAIITSIGYIDGEVRCVTTRSVYNKKYGTIGNMASVGDDCKFLYKVLK